MKFLSLIFAAASFSPVVLGAPLVEERQTTPVGAITSSLNILQNTANQNEAAITTAVQNAQNNVGAAASVAASVSANLAAIADGFRTAGTSIAAALAAAGTGVAGQGQALSQAEVDALTADLTTLGQIIAGLGATIYFQATNLGPDAEAAVASEVAVVEAAIAPVVNPIMKFADAASKASASAGATVTGLGGAYQGAATIINRFAATNGLPGVTFPGYSSI